VSGVRAVVAAPATTVVSADAGECAGAAGTTGRSARRCSGTTGIAATLVVAADVARGRRADGSAVGCRRRAHLAAGRAVRWVFGQVDAGGAAARLAAAVHDAGAVFTQLSRRALGAARTAILRVGLEIDCAAAGAPSVVGASLAAAVAVAAVLRGSVQAGDALAGAG